MTVPMIPSKCDSCSEGFSVEQALAHKKGGLITTRHHNLKYEFASYLSIISLPKNIRVESNVLALKKKAENLGKKLKKDYKILIVDYQITFSFWKSSKRKSILKLLESKEKAKKQSFIKTKMA